MPELALLPDKKPTVVVVGTSVRKPAAVLRHYLASLAWQSLPPNVVLKPVFVDDNCDAEAAQALRDFCTTHNGEVLRGAPAPVADFNDAHPETHQWSSSAMERVGAAKDRIIARARQLDADYVWFCDADLICDNTTLRSLLAASGPIATAVYWTRWNARETETRRMHAAPQVWLRHPYELSGFGWTEAEFRDRPARRQLTRVTGYGACTLLDRRALSSGVCYARIPEVAPVGMMAGEDRHFCLRAQALHLESWADPWPDIYHIYHLPNDLGAASEYAARLNRQPTAPTLGALVNLTIQPIEPLPWANGGWTAVPPQYVRGQLGKLALVPELEEAVYGLTVGETRTIAVHFPAHYPVAHYRTKRRLIRVTLNDCKPMGWAPVLETEMLVGARSGGALRTVDYSARQLDGMKEIANA